MADEMDDDNFATSSAFENQPYTTSLSPPPFQRSTSSDTMAHMATNSSSRTLIAARPPIKHQSLEKEQTSDSPQGPTLAKLDTHRQIRWSISAPSSIVTPVSPQLVEDELPSFYDSNDEDEVLSCNDGDNFSHVPSRRPSCAEQSFKGYSLPQQHDGVKAVADASTAVDGFLRSPRLLARSDSAEPIHGANLLGTTIDTGLDDFVSELGWIVDVIGTR